MKAILLSEKTNKCTCGRELDYIISPFMMPERRACKCGKIHYVDSRPTDWKKVTKN